MTVRNKSRGLRNSLVSSVSSVSWVYCLFRPSSTWRLVAKSRQSIINKCGIDFIVPLEINSFMWSHHHCLWKVKAFVNKGSYHIIPHLLWCGKRPQILLSCLKGYLTESPCKTSKEHWGLILTKTLTGKGHYVINNESSYVQQMLSTLVHLIWESSLSS